MASLYTRKKAALVSLTKLIVALYLLSLIIISFGGGGSGGDLDKPKRLGEFAVGAATVHNDDNDVLVNDGKENEQQKQVPVVPEMGGEAADSNVEGAQQVPPDDSVVENEGESEVGGVVRGHVVDTVVKSKKKHRNLAEMGKALKAKREAEAAVEQVVVAPAAEDEEDEPVLAQDNPQVNLPVAQKEEVQQEAQEVQEVQEAEPGQKWADHEDDLQEPEHDLSAPGEMGAGIKIDKDALSPEEHKRWKQGWKNNEYNQYASDMMSVHRSLPDMRHPNCRVVKYHEVLPDTSVIICFHNEGWSVLLRTVHSVIDRTPKHLLKEIILVDDFSHMEHTKEPLKNYMDKLPVKVIIVRNEKREGLIRSRILGFAQATAETVTFLDSHCECAKGWIEPLLDRIATNESNVVCPVIDVINDETLEFLPHFAVNARADAPVSIGGFNWGMIFTWHQVPERERQRRKADTDAIHSPTMAGGLFTISRKFFIKLGLYDPGMDIWGGENLELSFKTWMCGGVLEISPCSHVGHIFRKASPYSMTGAKIGKNLVRLADVWLDDFRQNYYERFKYRVEDFGDTSERHALRKQLQCKSFDWYLTNVYPESFFPHLSTAKGEVRNQNKFVQPMCIEAGAMPHEYNRPLGTFACHNQGNNQLWYFSDRNEIRRDDGCWDYTGTAIMILPCSGGGGNQAWSYRGDGCLVHTITQQCVQIGPQGHGLGMAACDGTNDRQVWIWSRRKPGLDPMPEDVNAGRG